MCSAAVPVQPVVQLLGPTASGKSALAEAAAECFGLDLVSVDSAQVYKGLDIGAAKPDALTQARLRYWLLDLCEPEETYSAARFVEDADFALREIAGNGRRALLVGGTGLYFRAFQQGLSALPAANRALREQLASRLAHAGAAALHAELAQADPAAARRIGVNDHQRLLRALEVIALTGQPLSAQQQSAGQVRAGRSQDLRIAFAPADRSWLHERIAQRLESMFDAGFIEEVRRLRRRSGLTAAAPSMRAVGYRQVWQWLDSQAGDETEMRARCLYATRQLAKRQYTWLRGEVGLVWLDAAAGSAQRQGLDLIARWLDQSSAGSPLPSHRRDWQLL